MNSATSIFAPEVVSSVTPKVGDVLVGSYGYDASTSTWVQVVAVSGTMVSLQELEVQRDYKPNSGGMYWTSTPIKGAVKGSVTKKKVKPMENGYYVKWSSYQSLYLGNLEPREDYNVH